MISNHDGRLLIVFFEGTANALDPVTTQIGLFANACQAKYVNPNSAKYIPVRGPLKMAFDGCGVTHGLTGTLFAAGLDGQCDSVVEVVHQMQNQQQRQRQLQQPTSSNYATVRIIALGLSRGAVACQKLALKLSGIEHISVSLLLFDPVPGNAVLTGFPFTAAWSQNLQECTSLEQVLAIYPYQPLPAVAMHAPCLIQYPPHCRVEEDVSLGCHQGALYMPTLFPKDQYDLASNLNFRRIRDWLGRQGVELHFPQDVYQPTVQECIKWYRLALLTTRSKPSEPRITHDNTGRNRTIVRKHASENATWMNRHHEQLAAALGKDNTASLDTPVASSPVITPKYQLDFQEGIVACSCVPII